MTPASCLLEDKEFFIILKATQGNETIQLQWFTYVAAVVPISHLNGLIPEQESTLEVTAIAGAAVTEMNTVQLLGKMLSFWSGTG